MKKTILFTLIAIFALACSFIATPAPTPTIAPTPTTIPSPTQYAGKWYGEASTEEITPKLWMPEDGLPEAFDIQGDVDITRQIEYTSLHPSWSGSPFIKKDGKTFLKDGDILYYWPNDLNPAMIISPPA